MLYILRSTEKLSKTTFMLWGVIRQTQVLYNGPLGETNLILNIHGYVAFLSSEMMRHCLTVHLIMQAVDSLD